MSFILIPKKTLLNLTLPEPLFPCCRDFLQFLDKEHGTERELGSVVVVLLKTEEEIFILLKGMHKLDPLQQEKITANFKAVLEYTRLKFEWWGETVSQGLRIDKVFSEIDFKHLK